MLTSFFMVCFTLIMQIICTIFLIIRSETAFIRSAVPIKIVIKRRATVGRSCPRTKDIAAILVDAAISEENAEAFQSCCNERFGAGVTLNPLNLIDSGRFEVKTANATIFVAPEQSYLLETRVIDGRNYLTIPVEEEIEVRTQGEKQG